MPDMTPWSVTATAGMSSSAARRTMSLMWVSPSSSEYSVWLCKWTNAIVSPFDKVGGARISVVVWLCALCRVMLGRKRAADASPDRRAASLPTALPFRHFLGCHDTSLSPHGVRTNSEFCMECPGSASHRKHHQT